MLYHALHLLQLVGGHQPLIWLVGEVAWFDLSQDSTPTHYASPRAMRGALR
jgi:hypothetical protein